MCISVTAAAERDPGAFNDSFRADFRAASREIINLFSPGRQIATGMCSGHDEE